MKSTNAVEIRSQAVSPELMEEGDSAANEDTAKAGLIKSPENADLISRALRSGGLDVMVGNAR